MEAAIQECQNFGHLFHYSKAFNSSDLLELSYTCDTISKYKHVRIYLMQLVTIHASETDILHNALELILKPQSAIRMPLPKIIIVLRN